ncbi:hypothetical protein ACSLOE_30365, partial [Escherichia coli]|uniref:hypothetical protein n=1 Tax=Escherichia coli TaxID=562 RepID=UPI003EE1833A
QAVNTHSEKQRKVNNEFFLFGISSAFLSVIFSSLIILSAYWIFLEIIFLKFFYDFLFYKIIHF